MLCLSCFLIKILDLPISLSDTQVLIFFFQICQITLPQFLIAVMTEELRSTEFKASMLLLLLKPVLCDMGRNNTILLSKMHT